MAVVWDEPKRRANLAKHGLDFADFEEAFGLAGFKAYPARASRTGRIRYTLIGTWKERLVVAAIVSPLGSDAIALVSLRPANSKERERYASP